jgi:hypothetical protein
MTTTLPAGESPKRSTVQSAGESPTISAVVSVDSLLRIGLHELLQARSLDILGRVASRQIIATRSAFTALRT